MFLRANVPSEHGGPNMTTNRYNISTETLLELVANPQRRMVLHRLRESDASVLGIEELTEEVVTDGGGTASRCLSDESRAVAELHHTHLPKMADAGIIEYDERSGTVRYYPDDRIERLVQFIATHLE